MKYLKIFTDYLDVTWELSDGAMGRLFRAMLRYAQDGTEPQLKGKEGVAWAVARQHIDREKEHYSIKVRNLNRGYVPESRKKTLVSGEDKDKEKDKNKDKDKDISFPRAALSAEKKETHPTLEEIMEYAQDTHLSVDVQHFYDYYEANGWHIGKLPMKDWKAALRAWARNATLAPRPAPAKAPSTLDEFRAAMEMARREEAKEAMDPGSF